MSRTQLQLEGPDLESLLDQVRTEYGDGARIVKAEKVRSGGLAGFFARERFNVEVEVAAPGPVEPAPPAPGLLDLAESVSDAEAGGSLRPSLSTETGAFADVLARLQRDVSPAVREFQALAGTAPAARPGSAPPAPVAVPAARAPQQPVRPAPLGLPARVLGDDGRVAVDRLLGWLGTLPHAALPACERGTVVAVAGAGPAALEVARRVSTLVGADPEAVQVATHGAGTLKAPTARRVSDPALAGKRRTRWAGLPLPTVVVVDAPLELRPSGWAARMLAALAPTYRLGAAAATTKPGDVARWAARLDGLDALAVHGCDDTDDPASVFRARTPVALVDGIRSTPSTWAALLLGRCEQP